MSDPRDRLLDHALREVLGESSESGPDLSGAVRAAWERGERRSAPRIVRRSEGEPVDDDSLADPEERMRGPLPTRGRGVRDRAPRRVQRSGPAPYLKIAAAATVLAVGGVYAYLASRPSAPSPGPNVAGDGTANPIEDVVLARADRALRVSGDAGDSSELEVGSAAFVPSGAPATVSLPAGAAVVAEPGTVFAFRDTDALVLGRGSLSVTAGEGPVALELPGATRIEVPRGAAALVALRTDRNASRADDPSDWLENSAPLANGVVDIEVHSGVVTVTRRSADPTSLAAGMAPEVLLLARGEVRPATDDELLMGDALRSLTEKGLNPNTRLEAVQRAYGEGTFAALREMPELWPLAADALDVLLDPDEMPAYARATIIQSLSVDPSPFASKALRRAWPVDPEAFTTEAIVAMAERGAFEFVREADAWLDSWDPTAPGDPFPVALYLATRADTRGVEFLRAALDDSGKGEEPGRSLLAAAGLARLGDARVWDDVVPPFADETRALIEEGALDAGALRVDMLAYAISLRDGERLEGIEPQSDWFATPRVGFVRHWVESFHASRSAEPRDAAALEEELALLEAR